MEKLTQSCEHAFSHCVLSSSAEEWFTSTSISTISTSINVLTRCPSSPTRTSVIHPQPRWVSYLSFGLIKAVPFFSVTTLPILVSIVVHIIVNVVPVTTTLTRIPRSLTTLPVWWRMVRFAHHSKVSVCIYELVHIQERVYINKHKPILQVWVVWARQSVYVRIINKCIWLIFTPYLTDTH